MRDLTEDEILQAIRAANLGGNTIRLTYDSGPYEVTRTTAVADKLAQAIVRKFCEVNRPADGVAVPATDLMDRVVQHLEAQAMYTPSERNRDTLNALLVELRAHLSGVGVLGEGQRYVRLSPASGDYQPAKERWAATHVVVPIDGVKASDGGDRG